MTPVHAPVFVGGHSTTACTASAPCASAEPAHVDGGLIALGLFAVIGVTLVGLAWIVTRR